MRGVIGQGTLHLACCRRRLVAAAGGGWLGGLPGVHGALGTFSSHSEMRATGWVLGTSRVLVCFNVVPCPPCAGWRSQAGARGGYDFYTVFHALSHGTV